MKIHCPTPHSKHHRLLVANGPDSIDESDITLATLSRFHEQYLRTAQVCAQIKGSRLRIINLQGAGPMYAYRRAGVPDCQAFFRQFQDHTGLKPINTLLAALVLEAKSWGLTEAQWAGENHHELKPDSILHALHFRRNPEGIFQLPLHTTPEDTITRRLTGADIQKSKLFEAIRKRYSKLFSEIGFALPSY